MIFYLVIDHDDGGDEGDNKGSKGEDEGSEVRKCSARAGYNERRRFVRTLRINSGIAHNQTLKSC